MYESLFVYDRSHCKQSDGVGMSFPLGLTFSNAFICHFGNIWLEHYLIEFKPVVYRSYADGTFLLFRLTELDSSMEKFHLDISCLNSVFKSNGYPKNFIDWCIKIFLDTLFAKYKASLAAPQLRAKAQLFKETCISRSKYYFDLQLIDNIDSKPVYNKTF